MASALLFILTICSFARFGHTIYWRRHPNMCDEEYEPEPDLDLKVKGYLYNRDYWDLELTEPVLDNLKLPNCEYIRFITHGYQQTRQDLFPLVNAYRDNVDNTSVISLDWTQHIRGYVETFISIKQLFKSFGNLIKRIEDISKQTADNFHFVGFGLGAHIFGQVWRRRPVASPLGLIVGLDPTSSGFDEESPEDRSLMLNRDSAIHVRILHTGASRYGVVRPMGHTDFYISGGFYQPGCPDSDEGECSHLRALDYMVESTQYSNCFEADHCASWFDIYYNNECHVIPKPQVIYDIAEKPVHVLRRDGIYFVPTNTQSPYLYNVVRLIHVATEVVHVSHTTGKYGSDYPLPLPCRKKMVTCRLGRIAEYVPEDRVEYIVEYRPDYSVDYIVEDSPEYSREDSPEDPEWNRRRYNRRQELAEQPSDESDENPDEDWEPASQPGLLDRKYPLPFLPWTALLG